MVADDNTGKRAKVGSLKVVDGTEVEWEVVVGASGDGKVVDGTPVEGDVVGGANVGKDVTYEVRDS